MWGQKVRTAMLCTFAAFGGLASTAAAAKLSVADIFTSGKGPSRGFTLKGRNGYTISVRGLPHRVFLTAFRGDEAATYIAPGKTTSRRIEARFGDLGRVSVRFRPSSRVMRRRPPKGCKGRDRVTRFGVYVGRIEFTGEGGYTGVDAHRVKGVLRTSPARRCRRSPEPNGGSIDLPFPFKGIEVTSLSAINLQETAGFEAIRLDFFGQAAPTLFTATAFERRPPIQIFRYVSTVGSPRSFASARNLDQATLRPPSPFRGEATFDDRGFRKSPYSSTWAGPLTVSLPGLPNLALAGPTFTAKLLQVNLGRLFTNMLEAPVFKKYRIPLSMRKPRSHRAS